MNVHTSSGLIRHPRHQHGQGIVEFIVAIGVFGTLLLGIFQVALLYRAKTTVDYAAFMAARDGSMHGATQASVNAGFVKGIAPLYTTQADAGGLLEAAAKAEEAMHLTQQATVQIVSPTKTMFKQVAVKQFDGVMAIPNDDLAYRSADVRAANVLKVKATYYYPLIVPVVDKIIGGLFGGKHLVEDADGVPRSMYAIPIEATAIVNMQSPIRDDSALGGGKGGGNPPGNGGGGGSPPPPSNGGGGDGGVCTGS